MIEKQNNFGSGFNINLKDAHKCWLWVVVFAIAFAWIESAVVVYLREIYFDRGFSFPLIVIWKDGQRIVDPLVRIEFGREIATIIVLAAVGRLAGTGKKGLQKFCFFMIFNDVFLLPNCIINRC